MNRLILLALLSFSSFQASALRDSPWSVDLLLSVANDDNLGRAEQERDKVADNQSQLNLELAYNWAVSRKMALTVRGFAESELHQEFQNLDKLGAGTGIIFRWQPSFGFTAPFYAFSASIQNDDYEFEQRDSTLIKSSIKASKRISDKITASIGLNYQQRDSEGSAYDVAHAGVFISADYFINREWLLFSQYSYRQGQTFSVAQNRFCNGLIATDIYPLVSYADAIEIDEAFNDQFCGNWLAYRIDADTQVLTLGFNRLLPWRMSVDFSVMGVDVQADGGNQYKRLIWQTTLMKRF